VKSAWRQFFLDAQRQAVHYHLGTTLNCRNILRFEIENIDVALFENLLLAHILKDIFWKGGVELLDFRQRLVSEKMPKSISLNSDSDSDGVRFLKWLRDSKKPWNPFNTITTV
jgi:hypothetical protein